MEFHYDSLTLVPNHGPMLWYVTHNISHQARGVTVLSPFLAQISLPTEEDHVVLGLEQLTFDLSIMRSIEVLLVSSLLWLTIYEEHTVFVLRTVLCLHIIAK